MTQTQFYSQQTFRGPGRLHAFQIHTDASQPPGGKVRPSLATGTKFNRRLNDERENNDGEQTGVTTSYGVPTTNLLQF